MNGAPLYVDHTSVKYGYVDPRAPARININMCIFEKKQSPCGSAHQPEVLVNIIPDPITLKIQKKTQSADENLKQKPVGTIYLFAWAGRWPPTFFFYICSRLSRRRLGQFCFFHNFQKLRTGIVLTFFLVSKCFNINPRAPYFPASRLYV